MGMFDSVRVKKPLPVEGELAELSLNWSEEVFQTKDLENLMDTYEITEEGRLRHLRQAREWHRDDASPLGGYFDVVSERWEEVPYHGVLRFYTSHCDRPDLDPDLLFSPEKMSWEDVVLAEGFDWWIEFRATFDNGILRDVAVENVEKTPIRVRLASNKEWGLRRERENRRLLNRAVRRMRKFPAYRFITRGLSKLEQKAHEKLSAALRKIS